MCVPQALPYVYGAFASGAAAYGVSKLSSAPDLNVPPPASSETSDPELQKSKLLQRRRAVALTGQRSTVRTSPQGAPATGQAKTLLGN